MYRGADLETFKKAALGYFVETIFIDTLNCNKSVFFFLMQIVIFCYLIAHLCYRNKKRESTIGDHGTFLKMNWFGVGEMSKEDQR